MNGITSSDPRTADAALLGFDVKVCEKGKGGDFDVEVKDTEKGGGLGRKGGAKARRIAGKVISYTVNALLGLIFIAPLVWMFLSAFNPAKVLPSQIQSIAEIFPQTWTIDNFAKVFEYNQGAMFTYFGNTLLYSLATVVGVLIVNSMAGYALAKIKFKGKGIILTVIVMMLIIPFEGITLSMYIVVSKLNMLGTPFAVILPSIMSCFYIFMFRQFFIGIPDAVLEAAEIDGCGPFKTFFVIVIPMAVPVFITVFVLEFFGKWNDFYWPLLTVGNKPGLFNLQLGVKDFVYTSEHYGQNMAALTICTLPIVILFLILQKYYIQGIATQGIKDM